MAQRIFRTGLSGNLANSGEAANIFINPRRFDCCFEGMQFLPKVLITW